jgi:hypothetical protein
MKMINDRQPRLEHANLVVSDIDLTLQFLQTAFPDWRIRGEGHSEWYGKPRRWLHFGDDDFYLTLNDDGEGPPRNREGHGRGLAHLGFVVSSMDAVTARLEAAGYESHNRGVEHPFRRNIYFIDGEGLEFEFVEYLSDKPEEKNQYD